MSSEVVIGIDGGGTYTRVMVSDLDGNVLSYIERGSASIYKDEQATLNVHEAIAEALHMTGRTSEQVQALAAGIAGYDNPSDLDWIIPLTDLPGLTCPKWHVNDAVSAHSGALMTQPGIVVIAGTGSIIAGITEDGQFIRNYDFHHYATSAARFISYDAVYETLAGHSNATDSNLIRLMLEHWNVSSISEFAAVAIRGFTEDRRERDKRFGEFAPFITAAAEHGSSVAVRVCNRAIDQMKVGIELIASSFISNEVAATFIGSVVNSPYFYRALSEQLSTAGSNKRYTVVKPQFSPVAGSVLLALKNLNIPIDKAIINNLHKSDHLPR
ncbi:BadF/BadG/BcrA/BcrD ATPase family protein [Cohnella luojiensis]|uniref:ATPase n=1 Tax=Cohnella luojiensis TaxID=652876 RepID=A0A4Y8LXB1_9BACL|nr:BadF/BadG/BcrA/BcrD ATPase family protein [Cohnella luojiensis]TFE24510.1 ATPase [Cohnella luojiensis]